LRRVSWISPVFVPVKTRSGICCQSEQQHPYRRLLPDLLAALKFHCNNTTHRPVMDAVETVAALQGHPGVRPAALLADRPGAAGRGGVRRRPEKTPGVGADVVRHRPDRRHDWRGADHHPARGGVGSRCRAWTKPKPPGLDAQKNAGFRTGFTEELTAVMSREALPEQVICCGHWLWPRRRG